MKIVNITPGVISIPPNGWGAVEKIIWEIHNNLLNKGHDSYIKYLNDISKDEYDIVHIHMANLANECFERGIPYYFTLHDHHVYYYGKDSEVFKENRKAIKNSILTFVPAKFLVDYFDLPNVKYVSHGVNTKTFSPKDKLSDHKLLCVAKNGYRSDPFYDRKGFIFAIDAAKKLDLPITIAGPESNREFLEHHNIEYDKMEILTDLSEEELIDCYRDHTIFIHPSELEAGHPNLTLLEAMSCGLPVIGCLEQHNGLKGMIKTDRNVEEISKGIKKIISDYDNYRELAISESKNKDWSYITDDILKKYDNMYYTSIDMKDDLVDIYESTDISISNNIIVNRSKIKTNINFIKGAFCEIKNGETGDYNIDFINKDNGQVIFNTNLPTDHWSKTNIKYFINWEIVISKDNKIVDKHNLDFKDQRIFIEFGSKSLGDTLAWIPYCEEFRKKHNCKLVVMTWWNKFFEKVYPEISFIEPGQTVDNIFAWYEVGCYTDGDKIDMSKHPIDYNKVPLQRVCSGIIGIDDTEIRPKVFLDIENRPIEDKYVCISIHSTAQTKYWNNPNGWQTVVDHLKSKEYKVVLLSKEEDGYMGNKHPKGIIHIKNKPIEEVMNYLHHCEYFIGISSGLAWLAWALNKKIYMISGFTYDYIEPSEWIRINAKEDDTCRGCWNRHIFDPSDWNWCPDNKGTKKQFECSKRVTGEMVIDAIENGISISNTIKPIQKSKPFNIRYDNTDNKIFFNRNEYLDIPLLVSIKDIDSKVNIWSFDMRVNDSWCIPIPKDSYDFENDEFGGFFIEIFDNEEKVFKESIRLRYPTIYKPEFNIVNNTEPIFFNYNEFFVSKMYDDLNINNLGLVIDIGANIGLWTKWILTKNPQRVISVEPNKKAFNILSNLYEDNDRVETINKAVDVESGNQIELFYSDENTLISAVQKHSDLDKSYLVPTISVKDIIKGKQIDLFKMDIEGLEFDIFDKMEDEFSYINKILVEVHPFYYDDGNERIEKIKNKIISFGYTIETIENFLFAEKI